MPGELVFSAEHLSLKKRDGLILDDISLGLEKGCLFGLIGEQGSGKTAFMRIAAGLSKPDSGSVSICGVPVDSRLFKSRRGELVGYMQQAGVRYPGLQLLEYMEFYAHAAGLSGLSGREKCMELLELAGLERKTEQPYDELCAGEKRLAGLARLMLTRPKLLLLDEPFAGVGREYRLLMEEILTGLLMEDATILLTTKDFHSVVDLCSHIGTLREGILTRHGTVEEVLKRNRSELPVHIRVLDGAERAAAVLRSIPEVKTISRERDHLMIRYEGDMEAEARLLQYLGDEGIQVYAFYREVREPGEGAE